MTPMPPEITKTLTSYRMIIGKLKVLLQQRGLRLSPLAALTAASLEEGRITVREAKRQGRIFGHNKYQTVGQLHEAGFVRCSGGDNQCGRLAVELTTEGAELGEAVRLALGGQETGGKLEAAE